MSLLARILCMKVVVTHHGADYERQKWSLPSKLFLKFCEWTGMTFANEIIVVAKNISDDVQRKFKRETTVIPNGVEINLPVDTDQTLQEFGLQKRHTARKTWLKEILAWVKMFLWLKILSPPEEAV